MHKLDNHRAFPSKKGGLRGVSFANITHPRPLLIEGSITNHTFLDSPKEVSQGDAIHFQHIMRLLWTFLLVQSSPIEPKHLAFCMAGTCLNPKSGSKYLVQSARLNQL